MTYAMLLLAATLAQAASSPAANPPANPPAAARAAPPAPQPAKDPDALPTTNDVRLALDGGDAAEALRLVSRLLALRGRSAAAFDRYDLLTLKAEAYLRLRAGDAAAQTFKLAAEQTEDREKAAVARASERLIRRSRGLQYTPRRVVKGKPAARDPLDLADPRQRRAALSAMFADEMAELAPLVKAAKASRTIPPTVRAIQAARGLATLELAANGSADQVDGIVEDLKQATKDMLTRVVERVAKRVDQITLMANDPERVRQVLPGPFGGVEIRAVDRSRGLKRGDIGELKELADTCDDVAAAGKAVAQASASEDAAFEDLVDSAEDLRAHITRMLRAHDIEY